MPPRRRASDHDHHEYWLRDSQYRFEDRVANELKALREVEIAGLREDVEKLTARLLLLSGGIILGAFLLTIGAPFIRSWLQLP